MSKYCFAILVFTLLPTVSQADGLLNGLESVASDSTHNRYLMSCRMTGNIIAIDSAIYWAKVIGKSPVYLRRHGR